MKTLPTYLNEYLELRQAFGFQLRAIRPLLEDFVGFVGRTDSEWITPDLALQWAQLPCSAEPSWWTYRLRAACGFADFVHCREPRSQRVPHDLLPVCRRRQAPYIYRACEVRQLVTAARRLPGKDGLRGATYATILGLLSVSGMRLGEAVSLDREDVDMASAVLRIRHAKFAKSRLVPITASTVEALHDYATRRDATFPVPASPAFFVTIHGQRPTRAVVEITFRRLCEETGLRPVGAPKGPRLHDLRHAFAVHALIKLYQTSCQLQTDIYALAVYLGHVGPQSTYWYLSAVPELLTLALDRLQPFDRALP